jgi:hypothetical protein
MCRGEAQGEVDFSMIPSHSIVLNSFLAASNFAPSSLRNLEVIRGPKPAHPDGHLPPKIIFSSAGSLFRNRCVKKMLVLCLEDKALCTIEARSSIGFLPTGGFIL